MGSDNATSLKFTGSIPANYDEYLGPMFFEDYAIEIAGMVDPAEVRNALELSCGTGRVTNHLRKALRPFARLTASDISMEMMTVAKKKLHNQAIEWRLIDFSKIPFDEGSLDLVVCAFGYMFAADKVSTFKEALRVLRPGGSLILSTWGRLEDNKASNVFRTIVKRYLGDSIPDAYKLPFSMHDPAILQDQLVKAGFSEARVDLIDKEATCLSSRRASIGLVQGGSLYNEIVSRNPDWVDQISTAVEKELSEKYGVAPMKAPMRALIARASK